MKKWVDVYFGDEPPLNGHDCIETDVCDVCGKEAEFIHEDGERAYCRRCAREKFIEEFSGFNMGAMAYLLNYEWE